MTITCPVIDLTPGSRVVPSGPADTHPTVLHNREAVLVATGVRIVPCHARILRKQYICVQCNVATELAVMKQILGNQNDTDIPMMAALRK